jgi:hypothetical protein
MTSCNRIKQVLVSLSLNLQLISGPFSVVIVDNSTPELEANDQREQHQNEEKQFLRSCYESGSKYLLTTNFPEVTNQELGGIIGWRTINFDQDPWNFSAVETVIEKSHSNPEKCVTLYDFNDIITTL